MRKIDLLCYSHIHEEGLTCDWELGTDRLASELGLAAAMLDESSQGWGPERPTRSELLEHLRELQQKTYDANGSIRGRCTILASDIEELYGRYTIYGDLCQDRRRTFVLPGGAKPAAQLHICRCQAKSLVRLLYRHQQETGPIPETLLPWMSLLANHLFVLAVLANQRKNVPEVPYASHNYGPQDPK